MERFGLLKLYISVANSLRSENGQALSEYSITMILLVIVTIAAITALGGSVLELIQNSVDSIIDI